MMVCDVRVFVSLCPGVCVYVCVCVRLYKWVSMGVVECVYVCVRGRGRL